MTLSRESFYIFTPPAKAFTRAANHHRRRIRMVEVAETCLMPAVQSEHTFKAALGWFDSGRSLEDRQQDTSATPISYSYPASTKHAVKLGRRFNRPITMIVGNQLPSGSWCQSTRQRI